MNQSETLNSKDTIEYSISRKMMQRQKRNIFYLCSLSICILLLLFYFALPSFQCKNIALKGGVNFTAEDCTELSGNGGYHPLIFLDSKKSREKLISASEGYILDCTYETNGFSGSVSVNEDFPHARFALDEEEVYFLSGRTSKEMKEAAERLSLDKERIANILKGVEEQEKKVPTLHLPHGYAADGNHIILALKPLSGFSYSVISNLCAIQYLNDSGDSTWNNVADVLLEKNGKNLLLKDCLVDCFDLYFSESNFPDTVISSLYSETLHDKMEPVSYRYRDTEEEIQAYSFTPYLKNGMVSFIKTPQKGA